MVLPAFRKSSTNAHPPPPPSFIYPPRTGGFYLENVAFLTTSNTLAPLPGRYLSPFVQTSACCYNNTQGLGRYNLSQFNPVYFARLRDFISQASDRGIVVNLGLISVFYNSLLWQLSPLYPGNNVNGIGANITNNGNSIFAGQHPEVDVYIRSFAAQLLLQLDDCDNWLLEIINEVGDGCASGGRG